MKKTKIKDQPLKMRVENGLVSITIGVDRLAWCTKKCLQSQELWPKEAGRIIDNAGWCMDILNELCDEEEDGTTPFLELIDECALKSLENGTENVNYIERKAKRK